MSSLSSHVSYVMYQKSDARQPWDEFLKDCLASFRAKHGQGRWWPKVALVPASCCQEESFSLPEGVKLKLDETIAPNLVYLALPGSEET